MLVFPTAGIYCLSAGSRDIHTVALWERYELKGLKGYAGSFKAALQLSPACAFRPITVLTMKQGHATGLKSGVRRTRAGNVPCIERGRKGCTPPGCSTGRWKDACARRMSVRVPRAYA